jgi:hypothetical protein
MLKLALYCRPNCWTEYYLLVTIKKTKAACQDLNLDFEKRGFVQMGRMLVKQPNGKFAVWSSIVDSFLYMNLSGTDMNTLAHAFEVQLSASTKRRLKELLDIASEDKLGGYGDPMPEGQTRWLESMRRIGIDSFRTP